MFNYNFSFTIKILTPFNLLNVNCNKEILNRVEEKNYFLRWWLKLKSYYFIMIVFTRFRILVQRRRMFQINNREPSTCGNRPNNCIALGPCALAQQWTVYSCTGLWAKWASLYHSTRDEKTYLFVRLSVCLYKCESWPKSSLVQN